MRVLVSVLFTVGVVGCGPHGLSDVQPTSDALAREVLTAISRKDASRLRALAISEEEFEHRVWPGLPAARPERNLPWSYVWMDLTQKSEAMLSRTLNEHGGRLYELQAVKFEGDTSHHGSFRVHRETVLTVRNTEGDSLDLRVFGATIEADGGWKVFSYVVDQ